MPISQFLPIKGAGTRSAQNDRCLMSKAWLLLIIENLKFNSGSFKALKVLENDASPRKVLESR